MTTGGYRRRDVTVADVAKAAQVSKAQAARALGSYGAVSDDVRERVLAAAEELGYRPNELARSMNTGKSQTIGVVVGDIENPHFGLATRGISDVAKEAGYHVILINTDEDLAAEIEAVHVLLDKRVDGIIVAPASSLNAGHLKTIREAGRPLVLLDRAADGVDADVFATDMREISFEATTHLLEAGHSRIAYISSLKADEPYQSGSRLRSSQIMERLEGMSRAYNRRGVRQPVELIRLNASDSQSTKQITRELLSGPDAATAIIASDGLVALSVVESIQELGLSIPHDVSFLMYDDFPWTKLTSPPLTVVAQPVYEMGAAAAKALIKQVNGTKHSTPPRFVASLVRRGSVGSRWPAQMSR